MKYLLSLFIVLVLIYIITNELWLKETHHKSSKKTTLEQDGYILFENVKDRKSVLNTLPDGYVFLDYKYSIKGCSLSTFHRDVTSSQYVFKTKYPVYTYIVYHNKGANLSICPKSHKTVPYLHSKPLTIIGKTNNTSVLFDCDVVHAGAINNFGDKRYVEQFKIAHIRDLKKLKHLDKIDTHKTGECNNISAIYEVITRKLSLLFSHIVNHRFTKYLQKNDNSFFNKICLFLYGREFYN